MASRIWRKGLVKASQWGWKLAREGFQVPVPHSLLDGLARKMAADPNVRDLCLQVTSDQRLILSGLKKKGLWVSFRVTFVLDAPAADDPKRSLPLTIAEAEPFFARGLARSSMAEIEGVSVAGERIRIDLDGVIDRHEWARKVPQTLRDRLRITGAHTEGGRLYLHLSLA